MVCPLLGPRRTLRAPNQDLRGPGHHRLPHPKSSYSCNLRSPAMGSAAYVLMHKCFPWVIASAGNRTRVTSMATMYSTTRPLMRMSGLAGNHHPLPSSMFYNMYAVLHDTLICSLMYSIGKTVWPSGLRRWLKAPFRKGVGSNPTAVTRCRVRCFDQSAH